MLWSPFSFARASRALEKGTITWAHSRLSTYKSIVGLQPTVIASRAPHLLLEQSVRFKKSWTCIARQQVYLCFAFVKPTYLHNPVARAVPLQPQITVCCVSSPNGKPSAYARCARGCEAAFLGTSGHWWPRVARANVEWRRTLVRVMCERCAEATVSILSRVRACQTLTGLPPRAQRRRQNAPEAAYETYFHGRNVRQAKLAQGSRIYHVMCNDINLFYITSCCVMYDIQLSGFCNRFLASSCASGVGPRQASKGSKA